MERRLSIKEWAEEDRPREKLVLKGSRALSEAELLAILIGSGKPGVSAVELSRRIMDSVNNDLNELGRCRLADLKKFDGIGEAKAVNIMAALELGRRRKELTVPRKAAIDNSARAAACFMPLLEDLPHEEFWVMFLNRSNSDVGKKMVSQGGLSGTVTDVRIILKAAIDKSASSLILCHNHPSGNVMPSDADLSITQKIKEAAKLVDMKVVDHIIIARKEYFSFADKGLI